MERERREMETRRGIWRRFRRMFWNVGGFGALKEQKNVGGSTHSVPWLLKIMLMNVWYSIKDIILFFFLNKAG